MIRAIKVSLCLSTETKFRQLEAIRREVRSCIQNYINSLWKKCGKLDVKTLNGITGGSLSYRYRDNCLKLALEAVVGTKMSAKASIVKALVKISETLGSLWSPSASSSRES